MRAALARAEAALAGASASARLDAELLLAHALRSPRSALYGHPEAALDAETADRYKVLIARRGGGEPLAYLTGSKEFWSLELEVSPAVLVPRPETETLVEAALERVPPDACLAIADLGTGSGAIALALARERPGCRITATDDSPAALAIARANAKGLGISNIRFRRGDWYAACPGDSFDLIASNPPYVAAGDPHLAALACEPRAALVAGEDGLASLRALIAGAPARLRPGGWLLLEHGADQAPPVRRLLEASGFNALVTLADLAGHPRVSGGRLGDRTGPQL